MNKNKVNWKSGFVMTVLIAGITSFIFVLLLVSYLEFTGFLDGLDAKSKEVVKSLQQQVELQSNQISEMSESQKKTINYLKLWTPIKFSPDKSERWKITGYGLPEVTKQSNIRFPQFNFDSGINTCLDHQEQLITGGE